MTERQALNPDQIKQDIENYGDKIFLNSAGSSLSPKSVHEKIKQYLDLEEKEGGYKATEIMKLEIDDFYHQAALMLGCKPHNIAFAASATDAYVKALTSIDFKPNDVILTTDDDYASNFIQFISLAKRYQIKIERIKNLENGDLDLNDFREKTDKLNPKLVSVTHAPTNSGLVQDVRSIGQVCNQKGVLFLVDACQSVGQIAVDVNDIKCDYLAVTGRKFLRGPRGTGILYVSDKVLSDGLFPLMIDGAGAIWDQEEDFSLIPDAKRFESWEKPYALLIGLTEAIRYLSQIGVDRIETYNRELMIRFRDNLGSIPDVTMYDRGSQKSNILTFRKGNKSVEEIQSALNENNVFHSISNKEWGFIDFSKKNIDWAVRLSPHYFNSIEEIERASRIIESI
ncbi:aminotransferase class V-fold PLP-dependent enzyme [Ekhidna sp. MALMAid0563]|uniref:aminotransferase class V-fold PLP-dependent enzyme n=1 Tax=Ekhidna sp. MALMAid0563 TaxID=3143937 RepID=UPI0032DE8655